MAAKKLSLDVGALAVESFRAQPESAAARGTVRGHDLTPACSIDYCPTEFDRTCNGYGTCGIYPCRPIP